MNDLAGNFQPGSSAIFLLIKKVTADKVQALAEFAGKGKVLQTSLTKTEESELRKLFEGHG